MARTISASVGVNAANRKDDVVTVQELLNKVPLTEGGPEPKLKVDGLCWQKTQSAIRTFQSKKMGHKWPDGRVDPGGKTLARLNEFDEQPPVAEWFNYTVPGLKPLIGQPINSNVCWAACYTMLRSWREGKKYGIEAALSTVGEKYVQMYKKNQVLPWPEAGVFWTKAGLQSHRFQCYPVETWLKYLRTHGLVTIGALETLPPTNKAHHRVVEGICGYIAASNTTFMQIMDPGWGGTKYNETFELFNGKYEALGIYPGWHFQVAHY